MYQESDEVYFTFDIAGGEPDDENTLNWSISTDHNDLTPKACLAQLLSVDESNFDLTKVEKTENHYVLSTSNLEAKESFLTAFERVLKKNEGMFLSKGEDDLKEIASCMRGEPMFGYESEPESEDEDSPAYHKGPSIFRSPPQTNEPDKTPQP
jgi:hypothetical protein